MCESVFTTYPSSLKRGAGIYCSYTCMGDGRKGRASYTRTDEHRKNMSAIIKTNDMTGQSLRITTINKNRKGKKYEDIYGPEKGALLRMSIGKHGSNNPNWKGGIDRNKYPYEYYRIRLSIIARDGHICLSCGLTDTRARAMDRFNRGLTVHHIDYNKSNNNLDNLITYCKVCNSRANGDRVAWMAKSRNLLGVL